MHTKWRKNVLAWLRKREKDMMTLMGMSQEQVETLREEWTGQRDKRLLSTDCIAVYVRFIDEGAIHPGLRRVYLR